MSVPSPNSEHLLQQAAEGQPSARAQLLERYRSRLRRLVGFRFDRRVAARVDPSDVVQDALHNAYQRMPEYFADPPASFYPWLKRIAWDRLVELYRTHIAARKRSVLNEQRDSLQPADESAAEPEHEAAAGSVFSPPRQAMLHELQLRVRQSLAELSPVDREILTLRYLEQLSTVEAAERLSITPAAATARHVRALRRLREQLSAADLSCNP